MPVQTYTILDRIFAHKQDEVKRQKRKTPLALVRAAAEVAPSKADFLAALRQPPGDGPALVAEIKRASPSRGPLAPNRDPLELARLYQQNGAAAISVLTDERFFQGGLDDLQAIAQDDRIGLPLLRKDFIFDPYQVYQARLAGADALLLIVACLEKGQLADLGALCLELGMVPLVEVHSLVELHVALQCAPALVGVNNRDLRDFSVDLETTLRLRPYVPPGVPLVSESGIHTQEHVKRLAAAGVDAVLVGEALVSAPDTAAKVRELACYE